MQFPVFPEVITGSIDEGQILMISSFCETMANQNGIVLITAVLSDHKLEGFQEILYLL